MILLKKEIQELKILEREIEEKANYFTKKLGGINYKIKQSNKYIEKNINKIQKSKLSKIKVDTLEIKALNKNKNINNPNKRKISMNLIKEKEKAIESLENKKNKEEEEDIKSLSSKNEDSKKSIEENEVNEAEKINKRYHRRYRDTKNKKRKK